MQITDTIAAISTAMAPSGIGIVRISGGDAFSIIKKIFVPKNKKDILKVKSHTIHYGHIADEDKIIDEVLLMIMKGPRTYSGEDTAEINCHGGILSMTKILETVIKYGARPADPGEFTKRAFLNGRIDLSQAEAVMDIIQAKSNYALKNSLSQLKGSVLEKVKEIRQKIIYHIAYIESALDDPEHISIDGYGKDLLKDVEILEEQIERLISSFKEGKIISEGIKTVIVGKPNVGKSSLLNFLLGQDRAIVTEIEGTTRDSLEETIVLEGISLRIIDTAGIRKTEDIVEKIGVDRSREFIKDADLVLYVVDASRSLDDNDREIIELIEGKKVITILNKNDLSMVISEEEILKNVDKPLVSISAKEKRGLELLEEEIKRMFFHGELDFNDEVIITNIRHKRELSEAKKSLVMVKESIAMEMPEDFYSIDLMNAYESLGKITGESLGEDLVNEIFSKFCTGK